MVLPRRIRFRLEGCAAAACLLLLLWNVLHMISIGTTYTPCDNDGVNQPGNFNSVADHSSVIPTQDEGGTKRGILEFTVERDLQPRYSNNHGRLQPDRDGVGGDRRSTPPLLPDRLITVTGLESSGTTFVATTLAKALSEGSKPSFRLNTEKMSHSKPVKNEDMHNTSHISSTTWIQHISLPTGYYAKHQDGFDRRYELPPTVPVLVPEECSMPQRQERKRKRNEEEFASPIATHNNQDATIDDSSQQARLRRRARPAPRDCQDSLGIETLVEYPRRFFVDIKSNAQWYQDRGVPSVTIVVVVRDTSMHFQGIWKQHCPNATAARLQYEHGAFLLQEAMTLLPPLQSSSNPQQQSVAKIMVVSYETLMFLRETYLMDIYRQLGIGSTYVPRFVDGNAKYINRTRSITT
jgi:hypothetical protein